MLTTTDTDQSAESAVTAPLSKTKMALYGLVNLPTSIVGLPIAIYIPAFYSQNLGLSLATVGALIALSRITDVFTDPAIGIASDRWQTRFGRRKPWMVAVVLGRPGADNALLAIAVVVVFLLPVLASPALVWVKESTPLKTPGEQTVSWKRGLKIVWANGPYRRLVISLVFLVAAVSMTATLSFFFVNAVMEQPFDRYALFILAYYLSSSLAIPIWFGISKRLGKHKTVVLGIVWLSLWSAFIPLLGPEQFWLFFAIMLLKGSAVGALVFLPASMAADVVDLDTLRTGEQRTGLYFSLWGMVNKGAVAIGVLLATSGVAWFGFDPTLTTENTDTAKMSVAVLYSIGPAVLACVALPLLWKYPLSKQRQERMRAHIERRDHRRLNAGTNNTVA